MPSLFEEAKKIVTILFKKRMHHPIAADDVDYLEELDMSTSKALSMHSQLVNIMSLADKNIMPPDVRDKYIAKGMPIPSLQDIISICIKCGKELCGAHGDLLQLRAVQLKYDVLFD